MRFLSKHELTQFLAQAAALADSGANETGDDSLSFFKRLAESPAILEEWATEETYSAGSIIFEEDEAGDALYLILNGQAAVIENHAEGRLLIAVREPGEIVGEMALVEKRPRMATVAALRETRFLCIGLEGFHQLLRSTPEFGLELMRILSGRLRTETSRKTSAAPKVDQRDPLTGIYTRAVFHEYLQNMSGQEFSLLLVDLDHFKSVNDGFGHKRGDEILIEFVRRAQTALRENDLLFRYGGDEFCVLLPDVVGERALAITQRLLKVVRETPFAGSPPLSLSLSIGMAEYPLDLVDGDELDTLVEVADRRVYQAKRAGRARVVGSAEMTDPVVSNTDDAPEISRLIERDQALESARDFLQALDRVRNGSLWVRGDLGSGHSRFLREVAANARLRNYAVFSLAGTPELKAQSYGAIHAACEAQDEHKQVWLAQDTPTPLADALALTLPPFVAERQRHGVLIVLDNADWLDAATYDGVRQLLKTSFVFPIGVVYASAEKSMFGEETYQAEIFLAPLTLQGIGLWLRHSLGWDAPPAFAANLHQITEGKPALLQAEVARQIEVGELILSPDGWRGMLG